MAFKDLFSEKAAAYARFRPTYPEPLFAFLASITPERRTAVDAGTGNGQAAVALARHFEQVIGLDPSAEQLASAERHPRVQYRQGPAEATGLDPASAELMTVAQALHWFKHDDFFREVRRVVREGGTLAVWCYPLMTITPALDVLILELYQGYLGPYWEPERRLVDNGYADILFPFQELPVPPFDMHLPWGFDHLIGYISTWSPLKRYAREHAESPLAVMEPKLRAAWEDDSIERTVTWTLRVRAFRVS